MLTWILSTFSWTSGCGIATRYLCDTMSLALRGLRAAVLQKWTFGPCAPWALNRETGHDSLWVLIFLVSSFLFYIHCLDWNFLVRNRQLLGYFVHTPTYFVGDLASMLAYIALLVLGARQLFGFATMTGCT